MITARFAAALLSSVPLAAGAPPVAPGGAFQVERYAVTMRPDLATTAVAGTETIVVTSTADRLAQLSFTANALQIGAATVDGEPIQVTSTQDAISFALPRALPKGRKATLRFQFHGKPARGVTAVPGGLYTSYFACDWMICLQDAPGDKAQLALALDLPVGAEAVAVGRAGRTTALANGLIRHRWRTTRSYSSYLYGFAAGHFRQRSMRTKSGTFTVVDATGAHADLASMLAQTSAIASFMAGRAGVAVPDRRYLQIVVPGDEAQEAAGFSIIGQAALDRERNDPSSAWIVAYEFAHQWWGNLVTCATWRDFWLNEGVTTFMVAAWQEFNAGPAAYRRELDTARRRVERARAAGFDKPLAWGGKYPSLGVRRAIQYSKGALFLADLRASLGDAAFWSGLRHYTRDNAGATVTNRDLQRAMERASGRDLAPAFAQWVDGG